MKKMMIRSTYVHQALGTVIKLQDKLYIRKPLNTKITITGLSHHPFTPVLRDTTCVFE